MDHDIAAGRNTQVFGTLSVFIIGVVNVQREVVVTASVPGLDGVGSLRGFVVALPFFRADRVSSQGDLESFLFKKNCCSRGKGKKMKIDSDTDSDYEW